VYKREEEKEEIEKDEGLGLLGQGSIYS